MKVALGIVKSQRRVFLETDLKQRLWSNIIFFKVCKLHQRRIGGGGIQETVFEKSSAQRLDSNP